MSAHNKVVWSEGLFLQPHHFQQQDRYFEQYVETRCQALIPHSWGFTEIELERDLLRIGKFSLQRAAGVFPDGTPFRMPEDDPLPEPLDVDVQAGGQIVFLGLPVRSPDWPEVDRAAGDGSLSRHGVREFNVRDATSKSGSDAHLEIGALRTRFLLARDVTRAYVCVPLAHIAQRQADNHVVLEEKFIPTVLHVRAATPLATLLKELVGTMHLRGDALASGVGATARGSSAEIAEFLMLQAINRYEPLLAHDADAGALHPEQLYRLCVSAAGELATFTRPAKRPPAFPLYRHDRLRESFEPVAAALREALSAVFVQRAISLPIESHRHGLRVAIVADRSLYSTAQFVLAARADLPTEDLRRRFPGQIKLGPAERMGPLVNLSLPGIPLEPMPAVPRQIPLHTGFVYFELDRSHDLWAELQNSGGIGMHMADEFPGLALEFWAIRS